jgi:outer membrane receptor protein involved in Fe transport
VVVGKRSAHEWAVYWSHEYRVTNQLKLDYGVRYSQFSAEIKTDQFDLDKIDEANEFYDIVFHEQDKKTYKEFEPRFSANLLLNQSRSIKFGFARNYQNVHLLAKSFSGTPLEIWQPSNRYLKPQISDQISLGYFHNLMDNQYEMSIEGFYKHLHNQSDFKDGANILLSTFFESELVFGRGWAYGSELFVKKSTGRFRGWLSYTLGKSVRQIQDINQGNPYPSRFDRTHDIAVVTSCALNDHWVLSANWIYSTGTPITVPTGKYNIDGKNFVAYSERNAYRMPVYHRLDIGITYKTKKRGSLNLTLYNAYGRKNTYTIQVREHDTFPGTLETVRLSLFSIMPSLTYNYTF